MKEIGYWWADKSIQLVEIDGSVYALYGWNGEEYLNCWKCTGEFYLDASEEEYEIRPIYSESDGEVEIIDYEVSPK